MQDGDVGRLDRMSGWVRNGISTCCKVLEPQPIMHRGGEQPASVVQELEELPYYPSSRYGLIHLLRETIAQPSGPCSTRA